MYSSRQLVDLLHLLPYVLLHDGMLVDVFLQLTLQRTQLCTQLSDLTVDVDQGLLIRKEGVDVLDAIKLWIRVGVHIVILYIM